MAVPSLASGWAMSRSSPAPCCTRNAIGRHDRPGGCLPAGSPLPTDDAMGTRAHGEFLSCAGEGLTCSYHSRPSPGETPVYTLRQLWRCCVLLRLSFSLRLRLQV